MGSISKLINQTPWKDKQITVAQSVNNLNYNKYSRHKDYTICIHTLSLGVSLVQGLSARLSYSLASVTSK